MPTPTPTPNPDPAPPLNGESLWPTEKLSLEVLGEFVKAVLIEMVGNRDVMWDSEGRPKAQALGCGETPACSWCHFEVDMSAIGMPLDSPLIIASFEGDTFLTWNLGPVPLAHTPKGKTAKETADLLDMNCLLDAFRRFVIAESSG